MATAPLSEISSRKARGAFFTPSEITRYLAQWAIRASTDVILEPSCGDAEFLISAGYRLRSLGCLGRFEQYLNGLDIHSESIISSAERLNSHQLGATLEVQDFFDRTPTPGYDVVIGNPPYIRYQSVTNTDRQRSLDVALEQGVHLNHLASSWAAFTVHATAFLKPGGRLALVLPAELLSVKYASNVRRFLLDRFSRVRLLLFEELVFPGASEEVVLLMAEGTGGAEHFEVYQSQNLSGLDMVDEKAWNGFSPTGDEKWTGALLSSEAFELYENLIDHESFEEVKDWGQTYLGSVTGNNRYFALTNEQRKFMGLTESEVVRISPPGSKHLKGLALSNAGWKALCDSGESCFLFYPNADSSLASSRYVAEGERRSVHKAYKCQVRNPWWKVPLVKKPDLLFTYMNHTCPRFIRNEADVHILNSLYGIALHVDRRKIGRNYLPIASLNSLTLLGSEIVGRSYGGGLLKFEPTEAARIPLPSEAVIKQVGPELRLIQSQVGAHLRSGNIEGAVDAVDKVLLQDGLSFTEDQIKSVRQGRAVLFARRVGRSRSQRG